MTSVLLLTKENCSLCDDAKDVLEKLRPHYGLEIQSISLESEEGRRLALTSSAAFPPVVFVDGELFSYGRLSERRLRRALTPAPRMRE